MSSPDVHIQAAGQKDSKTYFGVVIDPEEQDTPVAYRIRDLELKGVELCSKALDTNHRLCHTTTEVASFVSVSDDYSWE